MLLFLITCDLALVTCCIDADTIRTSEGKEIKGIVIEEYKDRLVFSTADGEINLMKSDVRDLVFDSEEDNLIKLAEQARERRDYQKSYSYYNMALKKNPDSKPARDGIVFLQGYLFRKDEVRKEDDIKRREEFERYGSLIPSVKSEEDELREAEEKLRTSLGMTLETRGGFTFIENVARNTPAYNAGIRNDDILVAVWARLTGYMPLKDVLSLLLEKPSIELKCTIERNVGVVKNRSWGIFSKPNDLIGASFSMEFDGLTIAYIKEGGPADKAGLKKSDLITAIDGKPTRYMPLKDAIKIIRSSKSNYVKFTLRREILIWRKD